MLTLPLPWTNVYGLARTLMALGTAATLAFSSTATLFRPVAQIGEHPTCQGIESAGVFCVVPVASIHWVQVACVGALVIVASGWRPRITALPHAFVSFSVYTGISIGDGGDQITTVLTLLLTLPALGDHRRWHWQKVEHQGKIHPRWALLGTSALIAVRLQMSFVYFQAAISKLPHAEWADGSAMWYWGTSVAFGAPDWLMPIVKPIVSSSIGVAILTWVPLFIEISLAAALLLPQRVRWILLIAGTGFHLSIAVMMGLWSFALAMGAGLVLLCLPLGASIRVSYLSPKSLEDDGDDMSASDPPERKAFTASNVCPSDSPASRATVTK